MTTLDKCIAHYRIFIIAMTAYAVTEINGSKKTIFRDSGAGRAALIARLR
jgi:hypothetical protein